MQELPPTYDRVSRALLVAAAAAAAGHAIGVVAGDLLPPTVAALLAALYPLPYAAGTVLCLVAARRADTAPERRLWRFFAAGPTAVLVAILLSIASRELGRHQLYVAAEVVALSFYALVAAGFLALTRPRLTHGAWRRSALDLGVVASTVLAVASHVWVRRLAYAGPAHRDYFVYEVVTPALAALAIVAAAMVTLIGQRDGPVGRRLALLIASLAAAATADTLAALYHGAWSRYNGVLWTASSLLICVAATRRDRAPLGAASDAAPTHVTLIRVPWVTSLLLTALVVLELPSLDDAGHRVLVAGLVVVTALVILRQHSALRENLELAHAREVEAARFRALVERSSDAVVICSPDGEVRFHNPALVPMVAPSGRTVAGRSLVQLATVEDRDAVRSALGRAVRAVGPDAVTVAFSAGNGGAALEAVISNCLAEGEIDGLVLNVRDVTDRRRLEQQLQEVQKLEALGRLAGGVAHDFNNLLMAIGGFAELLQASLDAGDPRGEDVAGILDATRRASALTRQLLDFARQRPSQARPVVVDDAIAGMLPLLRQLVRNGVRLEWYPGAADHAVLTAPSQLEQVVLNLVVNASDAATAGGRVVVSTGLVESPLEDGAPTLRLTVSDTGAGMDEATRLRAFEPFFTTKSDVRGTGLGLATVYGIVTQASGEITVESAPGEGTTVTVSLPTVDAEVPA